ncbi:Phosphate-specific transport system accessory protein PhoU [Meiothermus luteus]|jgi:phosphate transport system protein|uniref:Phosphate-specific transport system accessory protein PhoU n=1 Tax=Meiothermus luteus TaxID=2026184 RepID=A0A399EP33_9DEIN|nr:phosphate signaling complex protein PhoU [Meiothermus luteus]RIH85356.1 Phosphate-specific transport system accessory protein PhoU [Meiothermus luteus]RMH53315.1 MAG: phosphate signaling complex protein PhoU [Deinococcota bacterium]
MRQELDREISHITEQTIRMISLVREMVEKSAQALGKQDPQLAREVIEQDKHIDALELEIEAEVITLLARQAPVASDLRFAFTVIKALTDLERAGDYAAHVAEDVVLLAKEPPLKNYITLPEMGRRLTLMLDLISKAVAERSIEAAKEVFRRDDEIDALYEEVSRELLTYMMEDPRTITKALTLSRVARSYERLGDHLENISERILYWLTGKMEKKPEDIY